MTNAQPSLDSIKAPSAEQTYKAREAEFQRQRRYIGRLLSGIPFGDLLTFSFKLMLAVFIASLLLGVVFWLAVGVLIGGLGGIAPPGID